MNLQQVLLLIGAGVFLLIVLDVLRRRFLTQQPNNPNYEELDPEEAARQAELARELPGIQTQLDPLFDDLEVFDDDPIPLLNNQQQLSLSPNNKTAAQQIIAAKFPNQPANQTANQPVANDQITEAAKASPATNKAPASPAAATSLTKEQLSFNLPAEKPAASETNETQAWEKMRRKFELDPSFAQASRVSMQAQQKELGLLQAVKTEEALRYGAVKKQKFDQDSDLADLELPKNLLKPASKPAAASNKNTPPEAEQAAHLSASLSKNQPKQAAANLQPNPNESSKPSKPSASLKEAEPVAETLNEKQLQQKLLASLEATTWGEATEFLTLNLHASPDQPFYFSQLAEFAKNAGLHLSDAGFYHHLEESAGQKFIGFSLINMLKPGNFLNEANNPDASTQGLVVLTALPNTPEPLNMFERMLAVAKVIARNWGAELQDEHYSDLTQQTIEHYRQKIKDFEFQARINAIKASRKL